MARKRQRLVLVLAAHALLLLHRARETGGKIFSASIRWERVGATPHLLKNLCDPTFCQSNPCKDDAQGLQQCFINAPDCVDFNFDINSGCSTYDHRTVLYTVDAVFHASAFANEFNPPASGTRAYTQPRSEFCLSTSAMIENGEEPDCEQVQLSILAHSETNAGGSTLTTRKLIYTRYQRLVSYPKNEHIWKATATFRTVGDLKRFPQCRSQNEDPPQQEYECREVDVPGGTCAICLAPQVGAVIEDCKECLKDYADSNLEVNTTVHFADYCSAGPPGVEHPCLDGCLAAGPDTGMTVDESNGCLAPWDDTLRETHQLYPVTNHHSPYATMLPVVTIPRLDAQEFSVTMDVAAVDEDGSGRPLGACNSSDHCNNIVPFWFMKGMGWEEDIPPDGIIPGYTKVHYTDPPRTLTTHSDKVPKDEQLGRWQLSQRDQQRGGGVHLTLEGPLQEPDLIYADAFYPLRLAVGDVLHVPSGQHKSAEPTTPQYLATPIEFSLRVCKELKPYLLDSAGVVLYQTQVGKIGAIFSTLTVRGAVQGHQPPNGHVECFAGRPCVFQVSAMIYESRPGFPMHGFGRCNWGDSIIDPTTGRNSQNSSMCVDNVRSLENGLAEVYIDTTHAGLQGCPQSLVGNDGTAQSCHTFERLPAQSAGDGLLEGIGVLNITLFGNRAGTGVGGSDGGGWGNKYTQPYEFDIGKKISMCFQARECPQCCYSLPHCVTVEIRGRTPQVESPAVDATCPTPQIQSNQRPKDVLPAHAEYKEKCSNLYACFSEEEPVHPQSAVDSAPLETKALYSNAPQTQEFVFAVVDEDEGETADIELLWTPDASTLALIDPALVSFSPYTLHPGGSCDQQARLRVQDLYKLDATCREGTVKLRVDLTYSANWRGRVGGADALSPVYTSNAPQISGPEDGYYFVEFEADKTVCFSGTDNQAIRWGRGLNNSIVRCHVIRFRGPPIFERHHQRDDDSPFLAVDANGLGFGVDTLVGLVGKELSFTVRARDPNPEDRVVILPNEDPGLPAGATLENGVCVEHGLVPDKTGIPGSQVFSACAERVRVFRWTPAQGTDGKLYRVCFVARDDSPFCRVNNPPAPAVTPLPPPRATSQGHYSTPYCVQINVTQAKVTWLPGTEATAAGTNRILNVGCLSRYVVRASGGQYPVQIQAAPAQGQGLAEAAFPRAGIKLVTTSMSDVSHDAVVEWLPERGTEGSITRVCVVAAPTGWGRDATFLYKRADGREVDSGDPAIVGGMPWCFVFKVERCKYCVGEGETLLSQMRIFTPDMNWLRLWAFNGLTYVSTLCADDGDERTLTLDDPDLLMGMGAGQDRIINLGMLYKPRRGEDIQSVAERLRTTVRSLLLLNPDLETQGIGAGQALAEGTELCVVPCSVDDR